MNSSTLMTVLLLALHIVTGECRGDQTPTTTTNGTDPDSQMASRRGDIPVTTLTNTTVNPMDVSCADFDHCASYNNGCNICQCFSDDVESCTLTSCEDTSIPHCVSCETGYALNDDGLCIVEDPTPIPTKQPTVESSYIPSAEPTEVPSLMEAILWTCCSPDTTPETTEHHNSKLTHEPTEHPTKEPTPQPTQRTCSWFGAGCKSYTDGCNYCWCNEDGSEYGCSQNTQCPADTPHTRMCLECEDGFEMNYDTQCIPSSESNVEQRDESKVGCRSRRDSVCNTEWGFRCQADLECRASGATSLMCAQRKVCVEYLGHCESDADCDERSGYQCIAGGMMKQCTRYQME